MTSKAANFIDTEGISAMVELKREADVKIIGLNEIEGFAGFIVQGYSDSLLGLNKADNGTEESRPQIASFYVIEGETETLSRLSSVLSSIYVAR